MDDINNNYKNTKKHHIEVKDEDRDMKKNKHDIILPISQQIDKPKVEETSAGSKIWKNKFLRFKIFKGLSEIREINTSNKFSTFDIIEAKVILDVEYSLKEEVSNLIRSEIKSTLNIYKIFNQAGPELDAALNDVLCNVIKHAKEEIAYCYSMLYLAELSFTDIGIQVNQVIDNSIEVAFIGAVITFKKEVQKLVPIVAANQLTSIFSELISKLCMTSPEKIKKLKYKFTHLFSVTKSISIRESVKNYIKWSHLLHRIVIVNPNGITPETKQEDLPIITSLPSTNYDYTFNCNAIINDSTFPFNSQVKVIKFSNKFKKVDITTIPKHIHFLVFSKTTKLVIPTKSIESPENVSTTTAMETTATTINNNSNNNINVPEDIIRFNKLKTLTVGRDSSHILNGQVALPVLYTLIVDSYYGDSLNIPKTVESLVFSHDYDKLITFTIPKQIKFLEYGINFKSEFKLQDLPVGLIDLMAPRKYCFTDIDVKTLSLFKKLTGLLMYTSNIQIIQDASILQYYPKSTYAGIKTGISTFTYYRLFENPRRFVKDTKKQGEQQEH